MTIFEDPWGLHQGPCWFLRHRRGVEPKRSSLFWANFCSASLLSDYVLAWFVCGQRWFHFASLEPSEENWLAFHYQGLFVHQDQVWDCQQDSQVQFSSLPYRMEYHSGAMDPEFWAPISAHKKSLLRLHHKAHRGDTYVTIVVPTFVDRSHQRALGSESIDRMQVLLATEIGSIKHCIWRT